MATFNQIKIIYTLLGKNHLRDEKENIVRDFSNSKTDSVKDMTNAQAAALIGHLNSLDSTEKSSTKMRNKILSIAHEMHWELNEGSYWDAKGKIKRKVDMERLNNWCIKSSYLHKKLDDYSYEELPKLVSQFETVYKSFLKAI